MSEKYVSQSDALFQFYEKLHRCLIDYAPNDREAQRLRRCAQPHASGFITAVPSQEDGKECILKPRNFQVAVAYRLGVRVLKEEISCPLCEQPVDTFGDHATCCTKSGDRIIRHNALRNLLHKVAGDGLLAPELEKQGLLGSTVGRRPGDVTLPVWSDGGGLAIDVAVTSPLQKASVRLISPCEEYATVQKHGKYDKDFEGVHYSFAAMVWETLGAVNVEGEEVLRQVFSFAAKWRNREFSSFCGRAWAQFSCCLQRSVSQSILLRVDGQEFSRSPPVVVRPVFNVRSAPVVVQGAALPRESAAPAALPAVVLLPAPVLPEPVSPVVCSPKVARSSVPLSPAALPFVPLSAVALPSVSPSLFPPGSEAGVYPIRGDGLCGYHCVAAVGALLDDPRALDHGFECSYDVLAVTRKRILDSFGTWWSAKRVFYASDAEMEEEEVMPHVELSSQAFRARVNGGDLGKVHGLMAWPCELALYALQTDVLVVLLDTQRMSQDRWSEAKVCEELWFDSLVETRKKRVVCIVMDSLHFELAVVRTPELRFLFDLGEDWDRARGLLFEFLKRRVPGQPLGPKWEPPAGSALALKLLAQPLVESVSERGASSTHTRTSSHASFPLVCRNKADFKSPSSLPLFLNNNQVQSGVSQANVIQSVVSVESGREVRDRSELVGNNNKLNNASRSSGAGVEKLVILGDERGGGEGKGPKHSENTTHIDYHTHRFGANKSKAQVQHEVLPGSAKDGKIAQQGLTLTRAGPAKVQRLHASDLQKNSGARHYNDSRGENSKTYISSPSSSYNNSCSPHSSQSTGGNVYS